MSQRDNSWPPKSLREILDGPNAAANLERLKNRLERRGFGEADALDVIQNVLFESLQDIGSDGMRIQSSRNPLSRFKNFPSESEWWGYVFAVCENRLKRERGKRSEVQLLPEMDITEEAKESSSISKQPPELPPGSLEGLELQERAVFVLLREGFTQAEISRLMRVSPARVSQLKLTALNRLRAVIARLGARP